MAVTAPDNWSKKRPSYNARRDVYNTTTWRKLRLVVLRHQPICSICHLAPSTEVDHIEPLADNGEPYNLSNLQGTCAKCHAAKSHKERAARCARSCRLSAAATL